VTSKGQVTIPVELRKSLGIKAGDHLIFERKGQEVHLIGEPKENVFEKWRGIGTGFLIEGEGRDAIVRYFREMRGHDDLD
jgi:antitoxin PrlF